jgi:hypothetical protein
VRWILSGGVNSAILLFAELRAANPNETKMRPFQVLVHGRPFSFDTSRMTYADSSPSLIYTGSRQAESKHQARARDSR